MSSETATSGSCIKINFLDIPEILVLEIFTFLPIHSLLSLSSVSKQIRTYSENNIVWKPKCNLITITNTKKVHYKHLYYNNASSDWIKSFSNPSYAHCIQTGRPEMQCTAIINDNITNKPIIYFGATHSAFFGSSTKPFYGLYYYDSNTFPISNISMMPKPILFDNDIKWKYECVTTMDVYNDELLVCGTTSINENILILNGQTQKLLFTLKHESKLKRNKHISWTWQQNSVSMVKFADNGNMLYSSSPFEHGVILWDINKQKKIKIFNHRNKNNYNNNNDKIEIHSVCPTKNGNYFVSGSYHNLYFWDKRMNETNGLIKKIEFYSNNESILYPLHLTGFIEEETRFLCIGKRPSKIKTFEFPSFEYKLGKENDFIYNGELNGLYITPFNTVCCNIYGQVFLWNNLKKGKPLRIMPKLSNYKHFYVGSGYNGCYVNSTQDVISLSMNNPGSGWNFGVGAVFSIRHDIIMEEKQNDKQYIEYNDDDQKENIEKQDSCLIL